MTNLLTEKRNDISLGRDRSVAPREYHWTVENFYQAADAGVFQEPKRLELIHGRIIEKRPPSPQHVTSRLWVARQLRTALEPKFYVVEEAPLHIAFDGEPIPDVSVVSGKTLDYVKRHPVPDEVLLLIEVAVSSADYDLGEKALLYAQAGMRDYWVVLPEEQQIVVHRSPSIDGYLSVITVGMNETILPLTASDVSFSVRDLLMATAAQD